MTFRAFLPPPEGHFLRRSVMDKSTSVLFESAANDAEIFSLLAAFYNCNPEQDIIDGTRSLNTDEIADEDVKQAVLKIKNYAASTFPHSDEEKLLNLKRDWTKLFRAVSPDYGPKAPYEEVYLAVKNPGLIKELAALYLDADYTRYAELNNRHDYIGIQLDFAAFLSFQRANALNNNDLENYNRLTDLFEDFTVNHIASWFPKFCTEAFKHVRTDFYRGVLGLTYLALFDSSKLPSSYYETVA